jgi:glucose-6-phosphate 1-dehydrogenase
MMRLLIKKKQFLANNSDISLAGDRIICYSLHVITSPFVLVIFGATGDLARHKLLPALFSLYKQQLLPEKFYIVGFSRRNFGDAEFREFISKDLKYQDTDLHRNFLQHLYYQEGLFAEEAGYTALIEKLNSFDQEIGACITRIFYLATPPDNYEPILDLLDSTKLSEGCGQGSSKWTRIAIEKPFGKDLETAQVLDQKLAKIFDEKQIFRVDHYLGKDTVQNMIAFRFANSIFEPVWRSEYIDHVQITMSETTDLRNRGKFFDGVGNVRDVGQNHILQLAAAVAMEQPKHFSKEGVRDVRAAALKALRPMTMTSVKEHVVRAQFEGFTDIKNVNPNSQTETLFALKMFFDTPRFMDVPFYIRAGKYMDKDVVEMHIVFKQTCHLLFKEYGCPEIGNVLTVRIQPDEGIHLRMIAKRPGTGVALDTVKMHFSYAQEFGRTGADAYTKLLLDIFSGDQMLFNRSDELSFTWKFITDILKGWETDKKSILSYSPKTSGPAEVYTLIQKDGRKWIE